MGAACKHADIVAGSPPGSDASTAFGSLAQKGSGEGSVGPRGNGKLPVVLTFRGATWVSFSLRKPVLIHPSRFPRVNGSWRLAVLCVLCVWRVRERSPTKHTHFRLPPREGRYLVDPASSHMLVSKIKPCMSKYKLLIL